MIGTIIALFIASIVGGYMLADGGKMWQALKDAWGYEHQKCAWCGGSPIREHLDGDDLCFPCCNRWVIGERDETF